MSIIVHQTFEIKQDKFQEAIENLREIQKFRTEEHNQKIDILTPVAGDDHQYAIQITYDGLAEMELQNKKIMDDEKFTELIQSFFLEHIVQGSIHTTIYRTITSS